MPTSHNRRRILKAAAAMGAYALSGHSRGATSKPFEGVELNVRYLVDGEVRSTGAKTAITAHLVDTESGVSLWSDRLETSARSSDDEDRVQAAKLSRLLGTAIYEAEERRATTHERQRFAERIHLPAQEARPHHVPARSASALRCLAASIMRAGDETGSGIAGPGDEPERDQKKHRLKRC